MNRNAEGVFSPTYPPLSEVRQQFQASTDDEIAHSIGELAIDELAIGELAIGELAIGELAPPHSTLR